MEELSFKWFSAYYLTLGVLLFSAGIYVFLKIGAVTTYLNHISSNEKPPGVWVGIVRYMLLFTVPCLILSFFPFSWPELVFSVWCLIIIYTTGQLLVYWKQSAAVIQKNLDQLPRKIRFTAFNMLSIGLIMFLLYYHLNSRGVQG